jgi:hypothetical protein
MVPLSLLMLHTVTVMMVCTSTSDSAASAHSVQLLLNSLYSNGCKLRYSSERYNDIFRQRTRSRRSIETRYTSSHSTGTKSTKQLRAFQFGALLLGASHCDF